MRANSVASRAETGDNRSAGIWSPDAGTRCAVRSLLLMMLLQGVSWTQLRSSFDNRKRILRRAPPGRLKRLPHTVVSYLSIPVEQTSSPGRPIGTRCSGITGGSKADAVCVFCYYTTAWPIFCGVAPSDQVTVRGTIWTLDPGFPARLRHATVEFRSADGDPLVAKPNEVGEYTLTLKPGLDYEVTVAERGYCPVHRPLFRLVPGSPVRFDFTLTTHCPGDVTIVGALGREASDDAFFNSPPSVLLRGKDSLTQPSPLAQ